LTRQLSHLDLFVVAVYLLLIFIAGMWLTRRAGRALRNWMFALLVLFTVNFSIGWILLR